MKHPVYYCFNVTVFAVARLSGGLWKRHAAEFPIDNPFMSDGVIEAFWKMPAWNFNRGTFRFPVKIKQWMNSWIYTCFHIQMNPKESSAWIFKSFKTK